MGKILCFAGSTRKDSANKKLARYAKNIVPSLISFIDLRDFSMPLYDGDLEERDGIPENAKKLKQMILEADGLIIASPEYNGGVSGVLKNAIDWVSRPDRGEKPMNAFKGKKAAIMSASPSQYGGARGLENLRHILEHMGTDVLETEVSIGNAYEAFDASGNLLVKANGVKNLVESLCHQLDIRRESPDS
jgi:NAD(P)H-dependent FMN reductase